MGADVQGRIECLTVVGHNSTALWHAPEHSRCVLMVRMMGMREYCVELDDRRIARLRTAAGTQLGLLSANPETVLQLHQRSGTL